MDYDPINQLIVFIIWMLWCSKLIDQLIDASCCHSSMFLCCAWRFVSFPSSGLVSIFNKQTCPLDWWKHKLIWVATAVWPCLSSNASINWSTLIVVCQSLPIVICQVSWSIDWCLSECGMASCWVELICVGTSVWLCQSNASIRWLALILVHQVSWSIDQHLSEVQNPSFV